MEHGVGRRWHFTAQLEIDLDGDEAEVESYNLSLSLPDETPRDKAPYSIFFGFYKDRVLKRRGIVAVISDFQARDYERPLGILRRRHDVIALQLWDPREAETPAAGLVALLDPESGARVVVDVSDPEVRRQLRPATVEPARELFRRTGVDAVALSTAQSYERPLRAFFESRERRR